MMKWIGDNLYWLIPSLVALAAMLWAGSSALSAKASKIAAERSADAAERSALAAERTADAEAEQAALARARRVAEEAELQERPWILEAIGQDRWRATNRGPTAYRVRIDGHSDLGINLGEHEVYREHVARGESFTMTITRTGPGGSIVFGWSPDEFGSTNRQSQRLTL